MTQALRNSQNGGDGHGDPLASHLWHGVDAVFRRQRRGPGAYEVQWGTDTIRVLVLREMPEAEQNLVWNLFSSDRERVVRAFQRLQTRSLEDVAPERTRSERYGDRMNRRAQAACRRVRRGCGSPL